MVAWICLRLRRDLKSKLVLVALVTAVVIVAGAVVGGVFGARAAKSADPSKVISVAPGSGSSGPPEPPGSVILAHKETQVAMWCKEEKRVTTDHLVVFQDTTGRLVVTETYKNVAESFRLDSQVTGLPKPLLGSPIRIQQFGDSTKPDLHMFYIDDKRRLRHVIRAAPADGKGKWTLDTAFSAESSDDGAHIDLVEGRALSAMQLPGIPNGDATAMAVLYHVDEKNNTLGVLRSESPLNSTAWTFQKVFVHSPETEKRDRADKVDFQENSSGLLAMAALRDAAMLNVGRRESLKAITLPAVRIVWDISRKSNGSGVGLEDCVVQSPRDAQDCWGPSLQYEADGISDDTLQKKVQDAPKPLQLALVNTDRQSDDLSFVIGMLDGDGHYWETFWEDLKCTSYKELSSDTVKGSLHGVEISSFAPMKNVLLLGLRNGTLLQLQRKCSWWTDSCKDEKIWSIIGPLPYFASHKLGIVCFDIVATDLEHSSTADDVVNPRSRGVSHIVPRNVYRAVSLVTVAILPIKFFDKHNDEQLNKLDVKHRCGAADGSALSNKSNVASVFVGNKETESGLHRRLVLWQDDHSDIVVSEWASNGKSQYLLVDKLRSSALPQPKHGTPLAAATSDKGIVHIIYLDTQDTLTHAFETTAGKWTAGSLGTSSDPITASTASLLSATWHKSEQGVAFLAVAYVSADGKVSLALASEPEGTPKWATFDAAPLAHSVAGQTEPVCLAVTGDWQGSSGASSPAMFVVVQGDKGLSGWECTTDRWPPPKAKMQCTQVNATLQDNEASYILLALSAEGNIEESRISPAVSRKTGRGIHTNVAFRAMGTTDEGFVFAASMDNVYVYSLNQESGEWTYRGTLL
ncbi:LOW QUALITY PROTEIN: rap-phr extracellular signaling domain-containing protein [Purpureocillium lavendulum]|uniref:Rap-phr extracellular signaling domain-containing protein n=1 Tax=Purpureocillium lavendulum TaxID=1247861 RepID=A0AB34FRV5_9HYPO|nr:LOW QUALITY PROTEIN: rap-phr extracellular signaling domain-containing protein [Purpureocillium lavendulum]